MRGAGVAALLLAAAVDEVAAWGNRGEVNGPPGNYESPQAHDSSFQPDHVLRVSMANVSIACQQRESVVINGTVPGPLLRLEAGKRTWVRVYNDLCEEKLNTTIHWHGLSQRLAPFSDGTPQGSQWPIPPCHFFDYELFPLRKESGTFFYHSHVGFQAVSASGPLIIEDCGEAPYRYDDERLFFLSDYFNHTDHVIEKGLRSAPFVWSNETNAVLLNGVGVAIEEQYHAGSPGCDLPVIEVEPGKTYRFRFVGSLAISMVELAIDRHSPFTIIAADGSYTKPHQEDHMQLTSGQRFDTIFRAKTKEELNGTNDYVIQLQTRERPKAYLGYGVLRYKSDGKPSITKYPDTPPIAITNNTNDWAEYALEPLYPNKFPTAKEVTRRIVLDNAQVPTDGIVWQINGLGWNETTPPGPCDVPYLVDIYKRGESAMPNYKAAVANNGWDPDTFTFPALLGEVLEIIIYNTGSMVGLSGNLDYHPIHNHGQRHFDIGSGSGLYDPVENEKKLAQYQPVLRDTTNLYRWGPKASGPGKRDGWRAWRIRVEDAGVWMIHCHILQHMIMNMQSVWVMGNLTELRRVPLQDAPNYLEYGGKVFGNETFAPHVSHFFEGAEGKEWEREVEPLHRLSCPAGSRRHRGVFDEPPQP